MDSSRTSLPNVDRANSTLFKRYLDEQHKSVIKSSNYPLVSRPIDSTIQITHTYRQQQQQQQHENIYTSKSNHNNQSVFVKRKYSNGRKPSGDSSKQRSSHTSRFMKRFQRQYKNGETLANVQKRDGRPRFEFHEPSVTKPTRTDQANQCTCLALTSSDRDENYEHHHHCPAKTSHVPRLSLKDMFQSTSQHQRQSKQTMPPPLSPKTKRSPLPMLPPTINDSLRQETISNSSYPIEQNPLPSPSINIESETLVLDPPIATLPNEYYPLINDFLQELSIEMNAKPSIDILLEIEESLAQRIYDCIVEQDDENQTDTQSYSTATNDSSALSVPVPLVQSSISGNNLTSNESNELPPSPINPPIDERIDNREKYFQPIREQPLPTFANFLDRVDRHSTPFQHLTKSLPTDSRSPFTQSLFEPVNLLRTVNDDSDNLNFFPSTFSFNIPSQSKSELSTASYHHPLTLFNHLLPPRPISNEKPLSAFKPIEPSNTRSTGTFLSRPQIINNSTEVNWFGQS